MPQPSRSTAVPDFELQEQQVIDSLQLEVSLYRHPTVGARHLHLANNSKEQVFLVALPTVPTDSTGVAHVLEHTSLCGSRRYPVRDPFFMMLRRSLSTFMNALTSSDWTAYPFASQNHKDFYNLLDVYLDAVFFPRLDPLDFAQEGHRLEFESPDDPKTPLVRRGVVYNEMKGAMSPVTAQLWQALCRQLYPTTTYHHNSGGDPADIPQLSHEALVAFHRSHYHPGHAIFMSCGSLPATDVQRCITDRVLSEFTTAPEQSIRVPAERRLRKPVCATQSYALRAEEQHEEQDRTHIVIAWLLGLSSNPEQRLRAQLVSGILLGDSAAPLQRALEHSPLGRSPSALCGLDEQPREMSFICGLEGCASDQAEAVEMLVLESLRDIAKTGVPTERIEAVLHQLELEQREITGDGFPYGLQLLLSCLSPMLHGGSAPAALDPEPTLSQLRQALQSPQFIGQLVRELLLDNPHRVRLSLCPDSTLAEQRDRREREALEHVRSQLSDAQSAELVASAAALAERQQKQDDPELLPRVCLDDVPTVVEHPVPIAGRIGNLPLCQYAAPTNGLVYQQLLTPLPALDAEERQLLGLYSGCLPELGAGDDDYLSLQQRQSAVSGGVKASVVLGAAIDDEQRICGYLSLGSKALLRNGEAAAELLWRYYRGARFDEIEHLTELVAHFCASAEEGAISSGHRLAITAACSGMSPLAAHQHRNSGLEGLENLRRLARELREDKSRGATLGTQLATLHSRLSAAPPEWLLVAEEAELTRSRELLVTLAEQHRQTGAVEAAAPLHLAPLRTATHQQWHMQSEVHFCARAWPTVPYNHPDTVALSVLGEFLRNHYLHTAVRERGGAYGAGAGQNSGIAAFHCFSYRDPRLQETLDDFDAAVAWLLSEHHEPRLLEEAILCVISKLDKPGSPAGEAMGHYRRNLHGVDDELWNRRRQRVLDTNLEDLRRVAEQYLRAEQASTAVITPAGTAALEGFELRELVF